MRRTHLYSRPKTRFVAGFIGRTNLLAGRPNGSAMVFDHFTLPKAMFEDAGRSLTDETLFSVRPQSIALHRAAPNGREVCTVEGKLVQRTFLGETWDYIVSPLDSGLRLKVTALPFQVFEVGDKVWLEFDPQQMAPVA